MDEGDNEERLFKHLDGAYAEVWLEHQSATSIREVLRFAASKLAPLVVFRDDIEGPG